MEEKRENEETKHPFLLEKFKKFKHFALKHEQNVDVPVKNQAELVTYMQPNLSHNEKQNVRIKKMFSQTSVKKIKSNKQSSLRRCYEITLKRNPNSFDESAPSPVLPKVKFDSTGDFCKEPMNRKELLFANFFYLKIV